MSIGIGSDVLVFTSHWELCTVVGRKGRTTYSVHPTGGSAPRDADVDDMKKLVTKTMSTQGLQSADGVLVVGPTELVGWRVLSVGSETVLYPPGASGDFNWFAAHLQAFYDKVSLEDDSYKDAEKYAGGKEGDLWTMLRCKFPNNVSDLTWFSLANQSPPQPLQTNLLDTPDTDRIEKAFTKRGSTYVKKRGDMMYIFDDTAKTLTIKKTAVLCCFYPSLAKSKTYPYSTIRGIEMRSANAYGCVYRVNHYRQHFFYLDFEDCDPIIIDNYDITWGRGEDFCAWLAQRTGRKMHLTKESCLYFG